MSKAKNSSKVINWIAGGALAYFIGTAIAGAIKRKRESTNGIGDIPAWNKGHIDNYFYKYINRIPDEVQVWLTDRNDKGYVYVQFIHNDIATRVFYLSEENVAYLSELCDEYNVEFNAWDGRCWIPSLRVVEPLSHWAKQL